MFMRLHRDGRSSDTRRQWELTLLILSGVSKPVVHEFKPKKPKALACVKMMVRISTGTFSIGEIFPSMEDDLLSIVQDSAAMTLRTRFRSSDM